METTTSTPSPAAPAPAPTPTQAQGRPDLYVLAHPPEHIAYIYWEWGRDQAFVSKRIKGFEELVVEFTIHNDVQLKGDNGLYLILANGEISGTGFYFGLQTDVHAPDPPYRRGKGLLFSRWGTRDLANAKFVELDGWTQSSGHEGNFIGVRRSYAWSAGDYRVRFAPDESAGAVSDGVWFGLWITDITADVTTWIGSLKFPLVNRKAMMQPRSYSAVEIYGRRIRPIDIPSWHVSIKRPVGDGAKASKGRTGYSMFKSKFLNADVQYDPSSDSVHLKAGGTTECLTDAGAVEFK